MRKFCLHFFLFILVFIIYSEAVRVCGQEISLQQKKNAQTAYNKGIQSIGEDSYWVALEYLSAALDYYPGFEMGYLTRGKVNLYLDNIDEAVQDFTMAIELNGNFGRLIFTVAMHCYLKILLNRQLLISPRPW